MTTTENRPLPADPDLAARRLEDWQAQVGPLDRDSPRGRAIRAALGSSPFLADCLLRFPDFSRNLATEGPDGPLGALFARLRELPADCDTAGWMRTFREERARLAAAVAVADIAGEWTLEQVTGTLSSFAAAALDAAVRHLLATGREYTGAGPDGSGIVVLGMGKLGAGELNYSSDIDIVLIYDEAALPVRRRDRTGQTMVRFARDLVRLLQERTPDGYVQRVDLRLRPDPASTPLAVPVRAAEAYYESMGQNWERAAMLKARPVAGDLAAGQAFLDYIRPFIWRRSLDFWAIQDIHSIKRQIHAYRGHDRLAVAGHNVKLGRGGIREIEFYVQTQQLIWGGRDVSLRVRPTCEALEALVAAGHVERGAADSLQDAYRFLRGVEHRIQMIDDRQTHELPDAGGLAGFARFMGYGGQDAFTQDLLGHLGNVRQLYDSLFSEADTLAEPGNLVFTGTDPDPGTTTTLTGLGFRNPQRVFEIVRAWHSGSIRATRSARAREILTELVPSLIKSLAGAREPDRVLVDFDRFLARLPLGVPVFAMFQTNPQLIDLVAEVLSNSPFLAEHMTHHPGVLEGILAGGAALDGRVRADLGSALRISQTYQDVLDIVRRWANDARFEVGLGLLQGRRTPREAGADLSEIADATVEALLTATLEEFRERHGAFPDSSFAILAYGKWGSGDLTLGSDLDMVAVYDAPLEVTHSDGQKPLWASTYFNRLMQRLQTAITAQTGEGRLFEIDLRLRPSGKDGPLAIHIDGFERYQKEDAWTWEHMALVRSRVAVGPPELAARLDAIRMEVLAQPHSGLREAVRDMRAKMAAGRKAGEPFDLKHRPGGLIDLEFLAQYLVLNHAAAHPPIAERSAAAVFRAAQAARLASGPASWEELAETAARLADLQALFRLSGEAPPEHMPALARLAAERCGCPDFAGVCERIEQDGVLTRRFFEHHLEEG